MEKINNVCSLRLCCHSAQFLKSENFRTFSCPFDWIFSDPKIVLECIKDDFKNFLDRSKYTALSDTACGHLLYGRSMFYHRNPLNNDEDHGYYKRCVDRFKILMKDEYPKLFVIMYVNQQVDNYITIKNEIIDLHAKNYKILCVFHFVGNFSNSLESVENVDFLKLETQSKSDGAWFKRKACNKYMSQIVNNKYQFDIKK